MLILFIIFLAKGILGGIMELLARYRQSGNEDGGKPAPAAEAKPEAG